MFRGELLLAFLADGVLWVDYPFSIGLEVEPIKFPYSTLGVFLSTSSSG